LIEVLFGTSSQSKIDHVCSLMADLPAAILSPADLGIDLDVEEDGLSPEANARTKATAFCAAAAMPTFAIDAGLEIDQFPPEKQPGVFVRRVHEHRGYVPDHELIDHYIELLSSVNGESSGRWQVAIALATPDGLIEHRCYAIEALFTSTPSAVRIDGAPISSLMMDPQNRIYYSEMSYADRPDSIQLKQSLSELFEHL
jgi:XTP/dITP diphosphohydrolase